MRFISVTKPGIIFGNIVTVSGGFFLASQSAINFWLLLITLIGMSLVIACGCVFNNYIDRDIDKLMERTKKRELVNGLMSGKTAIVYAIALGILGFLVLGLGTNLLTVSMAAIGLFFYVVVYTLWLKRRSIYGTIIGGIAGAVPPVVGYCAVTNNFNTGAILLFLILFVWQIPHFYAISIYRLEDFKAASIPILPVKKNIHYTKVSMLLYIVAFTAAAVMPSLFGYTGVVYFVVAFILGLVWFCMGLQGLFTKDDRTWARKIFLYSVILITVLSMMMLVKQ